MNHFMTLRPAKYEEVALVRIPNVLELRKLLAMEQFVSSSYFAGAKGQNNKAPRAGTCQRKGLWDWKDIRVIR